MKFVLRARGDYEEWRVAARQALFARVEPQLVEWHDAAAPLDLFGESLVETHGRLAVHDAGAKDPVGQKMVVSSAFLELSKSVICHSDPDRFAACYRVLWRLQHEKRILDDVADPDVVYLNRMAKSVGRDTHKMKAFVRFREVGNVGPRRSFIAWFEPEHFIVARTAGFFRRRFADMDWLIATPKGSAAWDGEALRLSDEPAERPDIVDETDDLWRTYYANIFNPARLKVGAMQSEMPKKYWKNLPEAELIPELIRTASERVQAMQARAPSSSAPTFHNRRYGKP